MTTAVSLPTNLTRGTPPRLVYFRARWSDSWSLADHMDVDFLEFAASPAISQAVLYWRYGPGMLPGTTDYALISRVVRQDFFIKIVTDPSGTYGSNIPPWYGRVVEIDDGRGGAIIQRPGHADETRIPQGTQRIVCWGLEADLDRVILTKSRLLSADNSETEINRALAFNLGTGGHRDFNRQRIGNRSANTGQWVTYCFPRKMSDLANAREWTAYDAIEYLLAYYAPVDVNGNMTVPWYLDTSADTSYLKSIQPVLQYDGKSLRWVIDALTDRRRGAGWKVRVDESASPAIAYVSVFSQLDVDVPFPDGGRIAANPNQISLDFDASPDVVAEFRTSLQNRYDQVIVRGARRGSVCTLSFADATLATDWPAADETAYETAASGAGDYAALSRAQKQVRNDNYRTALKLNRAYSYFRLTDNTGLFQQNGIGTGDLSPIFPVIDDQGNPSATDSIEYFLPGLRIERHLPLLTNHDYSDDKLQINAVVDITPANSRSERLPLMVLIKLEDDGSGTPRYGPIDRLPDVVNSDGVKLPRRYSYSVRPQEDGPGLVILCGPKKLQHMFAETDFTPVADAIVGPPAQPSTDSDILPELDYKDNLLATVFMYADDHLEERHPTDIELQGQVPNVVDENGDLIAYDLCRRLVIDAPHLRLDWVVPQTVVGTTDGVPVRTLGGWLRDDRPHAKRLVQIAAAWYLPDRQAIELGLKNLYGFVSVGELITQIGAGATLEAVRTVVTRIRYDFINGATTISTSHAELDLTAGAEIDF